MPKFYCEYCGIYLTHSSPSGRRQHAEGKKHKQNQVNYYRNIKIMMEEEIRARAILKWSKKKVVINSECELSIRRLSRQVICIGIFCFSFHWIAVVWLFLTSLDFIESLSRINGYKKLQKTHPKKEIYQFRNHPNPTISLVALLDFLLRKLSADISDDPSLISPTWSTPSPFSDSSYYLWSIWSSIQKKFFSTFQLRCFFLFCCKSSFYCLVRVDSRLLMAYS